MITLFYCGRIIQQQNYVKSFRNNYLKYFTGDVCRYRNNIKQNVLVLSEF